METTDKTVIINDDNAHLWIDPKVDGETKRCGTVPRPHGVHYDGERLMHAVDMPEINESDFPKLIDEMEASQSSLWHFWQKANNGQPGEPRDQNGKGYCWAHSGVSAHMLIRARDDMPYADLSAYGIACQIKNFADEGGWGAQGLDWQMKYGVPTSATWPQQSMSRSNVNETMKADAAKHKIIEGWVDLGAAQYDRNMTFRQVITALLCCVPVIVDYNWWSHSVCAGRAGNAKGLFGKHRNAAGKKMGKREFDKLFGMNDPVTGGIIIMILNSWGRSWSEAGWGWLTGSKAVPDGATAPRLVTWTAK